MATVGANSHPRFGLSVTMATWREYNPAAASQGPISATSVVYRNTRDTTRPEWRNMCSPTNLHTIFVQRN